MGSRCPRWNNDKLLNKCEMQTIYQSINHQSLNYIHNIQLTELPTALYAMYKTSERPQRSNHKLIPAYAPKTKILKESLFFNYSRIYNQLPATPKALPKHKFNNQIKTHIRTNTEFHRIPKDKNNEDHDYG